MSRDNGYVIRKNKVGQFVLQEYSGSAESYPSVENPRAPKFHSLLDAVMAYTKVQDDCEYGLKIEIDQVRLGNYYEKEHGDDHFT